MRRPALLMVALLLVGAVAAVPTSALSPSAVDGASSAGTAASAVPQQATDNGTANGTDANDTASPGAQFAGVVGVQGAEVRGEIESRALDHRFGGAESDRSRAGVVAAQYNDSQERLERLRERKQELDRAYENGSMSTGEYHARLAQVTAQIRTVERLLNRTQDEATALPPQALEHRGLNAEKLEQLRTEARNMTGPETAAAARAIAGPAVGRAMGRHDGNETPPGRSGSEHGNGHGAGSSDEVDSPGNATSPGDPASDAPGTNQSANASASLTMHPNETVDGTDSTATDGTVATDGTAATNETANVGNGGVGPSDRATNGSSDGSQTVTQTTAFP